MIRSAIWWSQFAITSLGAIVSGNKAALDGFPICFFITGCYTKLGIGERGVEAAERGYFHADILLAELPLKDAAALAGSELHEEPN